MPIQGPTDFAAIAKRQAGRHSIPEAEFKAAQRALMAAGHPDDPCGRCACKRKGHRPKPTFSYGKSGQSSGRSIEVPVIAPTSCDCPHCFCSCVAWVEPEWDSWAVKQGGCMFDPAIEVVT